MKWYLHQLLSLQGLLSPEPGLLHLLRPLPPLLLLQVEQPPRLQLSLLSSIRLQRSEMSDKTNRNMSTKRRWVRVRGHLRGLRLSVHCAFGHVVTGGGKGAGVGSLHHMKLLGIEVLMKRTNILAETVSEFPACTGHQKTTWIGFGGGGGRLATFVDLSFSA